MIQRARFRGDKFAAVPHELGPLTASLGGFLHAVPNLKPDFPKAFICSRAEWGITICVFALRRHGKGYEALLTCSVIMSLKTSLKTFISE